MTHDRLHSHSASTSYRCSQVVGIVALASLAARGLRVVKLSFYPRGARARTVTRPASAARRSVGSFRRSVLRRLRFDCCDVNNFRCLPQPSMDHAYATGTIHDNS